MLPAASFDDGGADSTACASTAAEAAPRFAVAEIAHDDQKVDDAEAPGLIDLIP